MTLMKNSNYGISRIRMTLKSGCAFTPNLKPRIMAFCHGI